MEGDTCTIKPVRQDHRKTRAEQDWAEVTGKTERPNPDSFVNQRTGEEYSWLLGGIGWPSPDNKRPGFAIVMAAARKTAEDEPGKIYCLEEYETDNVLKLIRHCLHMRQWYGYNKYEGLMRAWIGDDRMDGFIREKINPKLNAENPFIVIPPIEYHQPNCFELYARFLSSAMDKNDKILHIGNCQILKKRILAFISTQAFNDAPERWPAIFAAGATLYSLYSERRWSLKEERAFNIDDGCGDI